MTAASGDQPSMTRLVFDGRAYCNVVAGVDASAQAVGVTLRTVGRNVALEMKGTAQKIAQDGVTIATALWGVVFAIVHVCWTVGGRARFSEEDSPTIGRSTYIAFTALFGA
jgi:hypothetical protein